MMTIIVRVRLVLPVVFWTLLAAGVGIVAGLTPDGGRWFHPGSPFTVAHQTPTRHVGKGGTRLQSDPYGMPSYGHLDEGAFVPVRDDPRAAVMDFGRPSYHHPSSFPHPHPHQRPPPQHHHHPHQERQRQEQPRRTTAPSSRVEPEIREYERQQYFRSRADFGGRTSPRRRGGAGPEPASPPHSPPPSSYDPRRMVTEEEEQDVVEDDFFFAGHPSYNGFMMGLEDPGIPSFFQRPSPSTSFSFAGRPSTSFHQRPLRPNFY